MSSDRKITLHEMYLAYVQRYAQEHDTSVKAVLEGLIDQYILPELVKTGAASTDWGDLQVAANRLLPNDWHLEPSFNGAASPSDPPRLLHMITMGGVGPIFVTSDALHVFGKNLQLVAATGGTEVLTSMMKLGPGGIFVRRQGSGLAFRDIDAPRGEPVATFPTRHVDKLVQAFDLAIRSQEAKLKAHYT